MPAYRDAVVLRWLVAYALSVLGDGVFSQPSAGPRSGSRDRGDRGGEGDGLLFAASVPLLLPLRYAPCRTGPTRRTHPTRPTGPTDPQRQRRGRIRRAPGGSCARDCTTCAGTGSSGPLPQPPPAPAP